MALEVKVMNFYPLQGERDDSRGYVKGSLHIGVQIGGVELNIRGILVCKKSGKYFFKMPTKIGIDHLTGKTIAYPILSFGIDNELNQVLLNALYEKGPAFVEAFLINHPIIEAIIPQVPSPKANVAPARAQNVIEEAEIASTKLKARDKPTFRAPPARKASKAR